MLAVLLYPFCSNVYVCLCVNFFSIKDFSRTTAPRILKFGTGIGYDLLYCLIEKLHLHADHFLYLSIFSSPELCSG